MNVIPRCSLWESRCELHVWIPLFNKQLMLGRSEQIYFVNHEFMKRKRQL